MSPCLVWLLVSGGVVLGEVIKGVKDCALGRYQAEYSTGIPFD